MADFVASIDQGTTSTRCMIFDHNGLEVGRHQLEHEQILPRPGWVEHNPTEIWGRTQTVVTSALNNTNLKAADIAALPQNQRDLWVSMPGWAWAAYAIGVGVGTLGAIGLILRKYWAPLAFSFSLIAIIIQFSYPFLIASGAQSDIAMLAFPMFIIVMAVVQWQLSRHWQRKGWLA